ncbi:neuropeptide Y receptor type 1-like [Macrosteles quadrilineatus]|uniref:neuropeptide Y receptor type 1-like n=1 Tax=Macrosteles quadrilineatus TaxID=74068 RepID=UPI0023E15EEA|nr:neuropeptide Y receptor type 1-like [Macrosteles quadrilineatus]
MDCPHGFHKCHLPDPVDVYNVRCALAEINKSTHINFSVSEALKILREHVSHDQNVNHTTEMILIFVYTLLIISGLSANLIISFVVARKTQMHSPRNIYIVNLTISDMSLCVVCMPFTVISIVQRHWDLGLNLCKLVPALQGANILVSVGTITVIALDRYFTIVCGQDGQSTRKRVLTSIIVLWIISGAATSPIFYFQVFYIKPHCLVID